MEGRRRKTQEEKEHNHKGSRQGREECKRDGRRIVESDGGIRKNGRNKRIRERGQ